MNYANFLVPSSQSQKEYTNVHVHILEVLYSLHTLAKELLLLFLSVLRRKLSSRGSKLE